MFVKLLSQIAIAMTKRATGEFRAAFSVPVHTRSQVSSRTADASAAVTFYMSTAIYALSIIYDVIRQDPESHPS